MSTTLIKIFKLERCLFFKYDLIIHKVLRLLWICSQLNVIYSMMFTDKEPLSCRRIVVLDLDEVDSIDRSEYV